jgi:hypothetical protein
MNQEIRDGDDNKVTSEIRWGAVEDPVYGTLSFQIWLVGSCINLLVFIRTSFRC